MNIIRPTTITDALFTSSNVAETDYAAWSSGTTYSAAQRCIVTTPNVHRIYESLAGSNLNHDPVTDCALATPLYWKEISATNRWKAFDAKVGSQTSQATSITYKLVPGVINSVALLNLDADSINIKLTDPTDGVVYNQTVNLISTVPVIDWYTYFFEPSVKRTDVVKTDLPLYASATLDITITASGGTAKVGEIVMGITKDIGTLKYGPSIGIQDYSVKAVDDQGNYSVTEGAFAKRLTLETRIQNISVDEVIRVLQLYRATLLVWVASESYSQLIVYGFFKDFTVIIPYPEWSDCTIEVEGII